MDRFDQNAVREALRLAETQEGKKLIQMLQQANRNDLQQAMDLAVSGDYRAAKNLLHSLLHPDRDGPSENIPGGNYGSAGR